MIKNYCQGCGTKIEFSSKEKPKFCCNCGAHLGLGKDAQPLFNKENSRASLDNKNENQDENYDEDDDGKDVNKVPDVDKLDFDFETFPVIKEKLGSVIGTSKQDYSALLRNPESTQDQSQEKFLENFEREAGSLRKASNKRSDRDG